MRLDLTQSDPVAIENFSNGVGRGEMQKSVLIKSDIAGREGEGPGISWFARYSGNTPWAVLFHRVEIIISLDRSFWGQWLFPTSEKAVHPVDFLVSFVRFLEIRLEVMVWLFNHTGKHFHMRTSVCGKWGVGVVGDWRGWKQLPRFWLATRIC